MAIILNIETSTRVCSVALAVDGEVVSIQESHERNAHAENITLFAEKVIENSGLTFDRLDAVAVSKGPGSYTGLRIGVSTAKGFCYSLDKPLIAINTLEALAAGMKLKSGASNDHLYCPMIDARRMEVYAAIYDNQLNEVGKTTAVVVEESSFKEYLDRSMVLFAGDGAAKCQEILGQQAKAVFLPELLPSAAFLASRAEESFSASRFENVAYFEPFYLKDFVAGIPKVKGLR